ncbi:MAG: long-chain fatty acid--CoA ligase [Actinobacteria bacterium]|nr:long-chain fatty acid--CoA ligase [Actinomycetota bacterium]
MGIDLYASPAAPVVDQSTNSTTVADMLTLATAKYAEGIAQRVKEGEEWREISYSELGEIVKAIGKGLMANGVSLGDKVAILANTRAEWTHADFAALCAGACVAPIYQTNSPVECEYVLEHSEAKVLFLENGEQLDKIKQVRGNLTHLELVVIMDPDVDDLGEAITLTELKQQGEAIPDAEFEDRVASVQPGDLCTIIYTSGTTGPPKGCMITHENYLNTTHMAEAAGVLEPGETSFLFLPLAHSFALLVQFTSVDIGGTIIYWERDAAKIVPNLMETKPANFPSVPRIFEKLYVLANTVKASKTPEEQAMFDKAVEVGLKVRLMQNAGEEVPAELMAAFEAAQEPVYSLVQNLFGGNVKRAVTGAAPIAREILEFFYACGVPVYEGYGMTETATLSTANTRNEFRFGSVGKPVPGVTCRIAEDGELLIKGANIFQGYYKNSNETAETLDPDGWLHTGDIAEIDEDGFVYITGRKKDIIITAGGKNLTPANFENAMKQNRWVSQAVMFADRKPYPVALITLDPDELPALGDQLGIEPDNAAMAEDPKVRELIQGVITEVNSQFAPVEQVKKFRILDHDLTQPTGELTPTLKVKRSVVYDKYADVFESMYAEDAS